MARVLLILGILAAAGLLAWQLAGERAARASRQTDLVERAEEESGPAEEDAAAVEGTEELRGLVKDEEGEPVTGVLVRVPRESDEPPLETRTGSEGRFRIDVPARLWMAVQLSHPDYLAVQTGARTDFDNEYTLERGARLTVLVLAPDGKPVEGAQVGATHSAANEYDGVYFGSIVHGLGQGTTGADGRVLVGAVPATPFQLRVAHESYATFQEDVELRELRATEHVVHLDAGGVVEGTVFDPAGEPLPGATVEAGDRSAVSGPDGRYRVERVRVGFVTVTARKEEYGPGFFGEKLGWDDPVPVEVRAGETTPSIDVHLGSPTFVTGRVTDEKGAPIAGAYLSVSVWGGHGNDRDYESAEDGRFRAGPFSVFRRAEVHVYARADGYQYRNSGGRPVEPGESVDVGTLKLAKGVVVRGRCVDAQGEPVGGASINAVPGFQATLSEADGRFELTDLPEGPVMLRARREQLVSGPAMLDTRGAGAPQDVVLTLGPGLTITGRVTTDDGKPRPKITVLARDRSIAPQYRGQSAWTGLTDDDGRYEIGGLGPGEYDVGVLGYGRNVFWGATVGEMRRANAGDTEVDFVYPFTGGIVTAKVVSRRTGLPLPEFHYATIRYRGFLPDFEDSGQRKDREGQFRFELGEEGAWAVEFRAKGYASHRTPKVDLKKGETHDFGTIRLGDGGVIEGRVVDAQGQPVPFTRINILSPKFETNDEEPYTGIDGGFRVPGVSPGMYIVFAVSPRHPVGMVKNVFVQEGQTARVEVQFAARAPLEVIVTGDDGRPLKGAELWWTFPEIAPLTSKMVRSAIPPGYGDNTSDGEGRIRQHGLPAGPVTLILEANGFMPVTKQLNLDAGKPTRIEIRMTPKK